MIHETEGVWVRRWESVCVFECWFRLSVIWGPVSYSIEGYGYTWVCVCVSVSVFVNASGFWWHVPGLMWQWVLDSETLWEAIFVRLCICTTNEWPMQEQLCVCVLGRSAAAACCKTQPCEMTVRKCLVLIVASVVLWFIQNTPSTADSERVWFLSMPQYTLRKKVLSRT